MKKILFAALALFACALASAQTESAITQAVSEKQDTLIAGDNISLSATSSGTVISATGGGGGGGDITVVQTTGQSTTDVMSQKAVTDIIGDVESALNIINNGTSEV